MCFGIYKRGFFISKDTSGKNDKNFNGNTTLDDQKKIEKKDNYKNIIFRFKAESENIYKVLLKINVEGLEPRIIYFVKDGEVANEVKNINNKDITYHEFFENMEKLKSIKNINDEDYNTLDTISQYYLKNIEELNEIKINEAFF